ncbi:ArgE Acetylornithine deacetylase/Succinyl-diaminopimelate desuccinylase and related deacylases [Paracoccaceae bacterium]|jgi:N-carbamoyl-L-amino-acid hydrolase
MTELLHANKDRLWQTLMASAEIGRHGAGLRRLALSDDDKTMRDLFVSWAKAGGYGVTVDGIGNIFVRREGLDPTLPPVVMGSHLDTQVEGGRFDGILGVLSGLEVLRALDDAGVATLRPIEVVNWTDEEGARFSTSMVGSFAFTGRFPLNHVLGLTDAHGITVGAELDRIGYRGAAPVGGRKLDAYLELHIEQGPELDETGRDIGLITGSFHVRGFRVRFDGETAHVGPTPMDRRRNSLAAAGYMIAAVNDIGLAHASAGAKTTCARMSVWPNLYGIVPSRVELSVDFRHPEAAGVERMRMELEAALASAAEKARVSVETVASWTFGDFPFDPDLSERMRVLGPQISNACVEMKSQAGHDAYALAEVTPTVMIFTPCKGGITHNTAEDIDLDRTMPGVDLLLNLVRDRADRPKGAVHG